MPPANKHIVEADFAVRYAETDAMGVVHHASYLVYFEEGRSQYMRELGHDYALIEADGLRLPVTEVGIRFNGSLTYGQRVRVATWIDENMSRRLRFGYEVSSLSGEAILVTGFTCHVWTNHAGKVARVPDELRALFAR